MVFYLGEENQEKGILTSSSSLEYKSRTCTWQVYGLLKKEWSSSGKHRPWVRGAVVALHKTEIMTRKTKTSLYVQILLLLMFFLFLPCECLDLSRGKMVSLQYTLLKETSHFSLKNMLLLENFPNRCISSRFYLFFAFCPLLQVLPSWNPPSNPSSLFKILLLFLTVKRAKSPLDFAGSCSGLSSNPNSALL